MPQLVLLALLMVSAALSNAAEQVAPGQKKIPAVTAPATQTSPSNTTRAPERAVGPTMETVRTPRITAVGPSGTMRRFYVFDAIQINFAGLGTAGEVRITVYPFKAAPAGTTAIAPPGPQATGCFFSGQQSNSAAAVIAADGTAQVNMLGFWLPQRRGDVQRHGNCRIEVHVERRQSNLQYQVEARLVTGLIPVAAHEKMDVSNTAIMRNFLRTVSSTECKSDDDSVKFAIRITAGINSHYCRSDFLKPIDSWGEPTLNKLPEGVFLESITWRLEGDTNRCELCRNPLSPCRGMGTAVGVDLVGEAYSIYKWVYAPVMVGITPGEVYAVYGGPPAQRRNDLVTINAHSYDYDTSLPDFVSNALSGGLSYDASVIGRADGRWRSWMRPFGVGMACSMWSPPSAADAKQAIGGALGQIAQGQTPTAPAAPYLRLVLDRMIFWHPAGMPITFR